MKRLLLVCLALGCTCAALAIGGAPVGDTATVSAPPQQEQAVKVWPPPRVTALQACTSAMYRAYKWDHGAPYS